MDKWECYSVSFRRVVDPHPLLLRLVPLASSVSSSQDSPTPQTGSRGVIRPGDVRGGVRDRGGDRNDFRPLDAPETDERPDQRWVRGPRGRSRRDRSGLEWSMGGVRPERTGPRVLRERGLQAHRGRGWSRFTREGRRGVPGGDWWEGTTTRAAARRDQR